MRVTVRVGDYKTDSSGGRGDGAIELAVLDNDPIALRSSLWTATDQAYKSALAAYAQKQAELKAGADSSAGRRLQPGEARRLARRSLRLLSSSTKPPGTRRIARASGLYRTDSSLTAAQREVQYSSASFHARATTTWLVTSEGTIVRKSSSKYQESFGAGTQAADGMRLDRSYCSVGTSLADLDSESVFNKHAVEEIVSLAELRKAPLVEEEYHGPLLLSSDAATDTLRSLLASAVTATRPSLGTEARTNGPFASSYHARVLPDFMNVVDDPSLKTYNGKGLIGAYDIDDEGVPAQAVKLVDDGRLDNYLIGRQPVRDFPQSNGHGRAGITGPARPNIGVLKITADNGLSADDLNKKLLDMAKDRGISSVYFVQTLGGASSAPALSHFARRQAPTCPRSGPRRHRPARSSLQRRSRGQRFICRELLWRCTNHSHGARPALRRRHRAPRQSEERKAAFLSTAGVTRRPPHALQQLFNPIPWDFSAMLPFHSPEMPTFPHPAPSFPHPSKQKAMLPMSQ